MDKFESEVKMIASPQEKVYNRLSDLNNLSLVESDIPKDKIKSLEYNTDSVTVEVSPVGKITLDIIDREPCKTIKFGSSQSPLDFNFWIQLLPVTEDTCKMKLTAKVELNMLTRGMLKKPIQEGIDKIAEMLSSLPY